MSFQDSVRTVLTQKYAAFDGRARRSEFWWFSLFSLIVQVVAAGIDRAAFGSSSSSVGVFGAIVGLALLVPGIAVGARRLHDTGRSGWWQLLSFLPLVGPIILIVWWAKDGDTAPNQHGVNPKHVDAVTGAVA